MKTLATGPTPSSSADDHITLQFPVQLHGQLFQIGSARSKMFEDRFKGSHVKLWMNYRFHLQSISGNYGQELTLTS